MKRFFLKQLSLVLTIAMLMSIAGIAEDGFIGAVDQTYASDAAGASIDEDSSEGDVVEAEPVEPVAGEGEETELVTGGEGQETPASGENEGELPGENNPVDGENETPAGEGDEIPAEGGDEAPAEGGDETPAEGGDETPAVDGGETPAEGGDETPTENGGETPAEGGDETPTENGDETSAEGGDEAPAEGGDETPTGDGVTSEEDVEEAVVEDTASQADAKLEIVAPVEEHVNADTSDTEIIEVAEPEAPKLAAEAGGIPGALVMGLKEKYQLTGGSGYTSSNPKVATVSPSGLIVAKKKGSATITAGAAVCQVTVKNAPKKITLPKKQNTVVGQSIVLNASVKGGASATITWTSSNPGVATVDSKGFVTGTGMGKAKITAKTYNKKKAVCTVTVDSPNAPTMVSFPMGTLFVGKGESVTLKPVLNPGAETSFTFVSKNKKVAAVGKTTGVLKGKKLKKSTKITVTTQNKKKTTLTVKVLKPASGISLNIPSATMDVGGAGALTASIPAGTASQVYWSSDNPGVATVSDSSPFSDGTGSTIIVTAVGGGTANITARTFNGKTASCTITVNPPAALPQNSGLSTDNTPSGNDTGNNNQNAPASGVKLDAGNFPDSNLLSIVSRFDSDGDGALSDGEVSSLNRLNLNDTNVASLKGIEKLTSLTGLTCENSGLTDADMSGNTALTSLDLSDNCLTGLNISKNTALTNLDVSGNTSLADLDISKNTALTNLNVSGTGITELDVSNNPVLVDCVKNGSVIDIGNAITYSKDGVVLTVNKNITVNTEKNTFRPVTAVTIYFGDTAAGTSVVVLPDDAVTASWSANGDVSSYSFEITGNNGTYASAFNTQDSSFTIGSNAITAGVEYMLTVTATPMDGGSAVTQTARFKRNAAIVVGTINSLRISLGSTVAGSDVIVIGDNDVTASWSATGSVESYYYELRNAANQLIASENATTDTTYTIAAGAITAGEVYSLKVGVMPTNGSASNIVWKTARFKRNIPGPVYQPVTTVTIKFGDNAAGSDTVVIPDSAVTASWSANGDVASYSYAISSNSGTLVSESNIQTTSYSIAANAITAGEEYTLTVTATPADGGSAVTQTAKFKRYTPVTAVTIKFGDDAAGSDTVIIPDSPVTASWSADGDVASYSYEIVNTSDNTVVTSASNIQTASYSIGTSTFTKGVVYKLTITATPANGGSDVSQTAKFKRYKQVSAVTIKFGNTTAGNNTVTIPDSAVTASWSADGDVASYSYTIASTSGTLASESNIQATSYSIGANAINAGEEYTLTVTATPSNGSNAVTKTAKFKRNAVASVYTPVTAVTIKFDDDAAGSDTVIIPDSPVTASWSADGDVASYSYEIVNTSDNTVVTSASNIQTASYSIGTSTFTKGVVYKLTVTATPANGGSDVTQTAKFKRYKSVTAVTIKFGNTTAGSSTVAIADSAVTASWSADGDVDSYTYKITSSYGTLASGSNTQATSYTIGAGAITAGVIYTLTVTATPANGGSVVTKTSMFKRYRPVTAVTIKFGSTTAGDDTVVIPDSSVTASWSANGDVKNYSYEIVNTSDNSVVKSESSTTSTSYSIGTSTITNGVVYKLSVTAKPANNGSAVTKTAWFRQNSPVTDLTVKFGNVTAGTDIFVLPDTAVAASWFADGDVSSYSYTIVDSNNQTVASASNTQVTSYTIGTDAITAGEIYTLSVTATPANGGSNVTKTVRFKRNKVITAVTIKFGDTTAGTGVVVLPDNSVAATWSADGDVVNYSYTIVDSSNQTVASASNTQVTSYTIGAGAITAGEVYTLTVTAKSAKDGSIKSKTAKFKRNKAVSAVTIKFGDTTAGTDVVVLPDTAVTASWSANGDVSSYSYKILNVSNQAVVSVNNSQATSYTIGTSNFTKGEVYTLTVTAKPANGGSAVTQTARFKRNKPVTAVTIKFGNTTAGTGVVVLPDDAVTATWSANGDVSGYTYKILNARYQVIKSENNSQTTSYTIGADAITLGEEYTLSVTAIPANGGSSVTQTAKFKRNPLTVGTVNSVTISFDGVAAGSDTVLISDNTVTASWSAEGDVESYYYKLLNASNGVVTHKEATQLTSYTIAQNGITAGKVYTLKVGVMPTNGTEDDIVWVTARFVRPGDFLMSNGVVTGYKGSGGAITIPSVDYDGNVITAIGAEAFKGKTSITEVTVSTKVTGIGASAFEGCTNLVRITVPKGIKMIGDMAFKDCINFMGMKKS